MRAADTNILVRFFTGDDPRQSEAATQFVRECSEHREPIFVSVPVLCELVWVLRVSYGRNKFQIVEILDGILSRQLFRVDQEPLARIAVDRYRDGKANFSDYLIGAIAADAGCRDTVSFDRDLKGAAGFTIL